MKVREIMTQTVQKIGPDSTIKAAAKKMKKYKIGSLLVVKDERAKGIITEGDIMKAVADGRNPDKCPVSDYMTEEIVVTRPEATLEEAAEMMVTHKVKKLPVLEGEELVGIVTATDLIKQGEMMIESISSLFFTQRSLLQGG